MAADSKIITYCIFAFSFLTAGVTSETPCGDWEPYKDEKCLKVFVNPGLASYTDAENFCQATEQDQSFLLSIGLEEKQSFVESFLKSKNIVDNVWIGLKYVDGTYQWTDASEFQYTNWGYGSPRNDPNYCVQIETDELFFGNWTEVVCSKKNLIICEKLQSWSQSYLQDEVIKLQISVNQSKDTEKILDSRISQLESSNTQLQTAVDESKATEQNLDARISQLESSNAQLAADLENLKNALSDVSKNPFPVGFVYVQLPNEPAPAEIWNWMGWQDISPNYAGLFFRTEGGGSAAFGQVQEADNPRLVGLRIVKQPPTWVDELHLKPDGQWSAAIHAGPSENDYELEAMVSNAELRPRNMAIRIWKRVN